MVHIAASGMTVMVAVGHRQIMYVTVRNRRIRVFMLRGRDFAPEMR
ncbi:hypothetical protein [Paraburkholderia sediminicola]